MGKVIDHDLILSGMAEGKTLRGMCRENGWAESTARLQLSSDETLAARYARARELQADHYADRISDDATDPTIDPAEKRARIDALKWVAGKLRPKVYGDRVALANDVENPLIKAPPTVAEMVTELKARIAHEREAEQARLAGPTREE